MGIEMLLEPPTLTRASPLEQRNSDHSPPQHQEEELCGVWIHLPPTATATDSAITTTTTGTNDTATGTAMDLKHLLVWGVCTQYLVTARLRAAHSTRTDTEINAANSTSLTFYLVRKI